MVKDNAISAYKNAGTVLHDAVKTLRTNILFSSVDEPIKTIVVTSVIPHEGKSTISIFLAIAMAESGLRTLLVECDCRRPMLQNYMKLRPNFGLIELLRRQISFQEAVMPTEVPKLDLLSCSVLANPVEILGSERFKKVIEEQREDYDIIILDTPPLGSFIEAAILASRADGTVMVLQPGSTDISAAQSVVAQLEKAKARILGVVLNGVDMSGSDYYYSDYYYRGGKKKRKKSSKGHSGRETAERAEGRQYAEIVPNKTSAKPESVPEKPAVEEKSRNAEATVIQEQNVKEPSPASTYKPSTYAAATTAEAAKEARDPFADGLSPEERAQMIREAMKASMSASHHE